MDTIHPYEQELTGDHFGTKTSYFARANTNDSAPEVEGCEQETLWMLARHGTRNPGDDDILEMGERLPGLRDQVVSAWEAGLSSLEEEDIIRLTQWTFNLVAEDDSLLVE